MKFDVFIRYKTSAVVLYNIIPETVAKSEIFLSKRGGKRQRKSKEKITCKSRQISDSSIVVYVQFGGVKEGSMDIAINVGRLHARSYCKRHFFIKKMINTGYTNICTHISLSLSYYLFYIHSFML